MTRPSAASSLAGRLRTVATRAHPTRGIEIVVVLLLPATFLWLVGSEAQTPLYTPDSEFYLSLQHFGSEVTDRAPFPAYYWTRLGAILPAHTLIELLGDSTGALVWRWLLISVVAASCYSVARLLAPGMVAATTGALIAVANSVFLTSLGNPYVTSVALPAITATLALTLTALAARSDFAFVAMSLLAGAAIGWSVAINTVAGAYALFGSVLIGSIWIALNRGPVKRLSAFLLAGAGAAISLFFFIAWGRGAFPGMSWLEVVVSYSQQLDPSAYRQGGVSWLNSSTVLLAPVGALGIGLATYAAAKRYGRSPLSARILLTCAITTGAFLLAAGVQEFVLNAAILQVGTYRPYIWAPVLLALATSVAFLVGAHGSSRARIAFLLALPAAVAVSGHWISPFGTMVTGGLSALIVMAILWTGAMVFAQRRGSATATAACITLSAASLMLIQGLQNGGPPGIPNWSAYRDYGVKDQYQLALESESWVLSNTSAHDRILVWGYPGGLNVSMAAMGLWGPNTLGFSAEADPSDVERARIAGANAFALYGTRMQIEGYVRSLAVHGITVRHLRCAAFKRPTLSVDVCVARSAAEPTAE